MEYTLDDDLVELNFTSVKELVSLLPKGFQPVHKTLYWSTDTIFRTKQIKHVEAQTLPQSVLLEVGWVKWSLVGSAVVTIVLVFLALLVRYRRKEERYSVDISLNNGQTCSTYTIDRSERGSDDMKIALDKVDKSNDKSVGAEGWQPQNLVTYRKLECLDLAHIDTISEVGGHAVDGYGGLRGQPRQTAPDRDRWGWEEQDSSSVSGRTAVRWSTLQPDRTRTFPTTGAIPAVTESGGRGGNAHGSVCGRTSASAAGFRAARSSSASLEKVKVSFNNNLYTVRLTDAGATSATSSTASSLSRNNPNNDTAGSSDCRLDSGIMTADGDMDDDDGGEISRLYPAVNGYHHDERIVLPPSSSTKFNASRSGTAEDLVPILSTFRSHNGRQSVVSASEVPTACGSDAQQERETLCTQQEQEFHNSVIQIFSLNR